MKVKRFCFICITVMALAALLTISAYAENWWSEASADVSAYPVSPPLARGDLDGNGTVDAADARQTLRFAVGLDAGLLAYSADPDYDGDGRITAEDARLVLRCSVGLEGTATPRADDGVYRIRVYSLFGEYSDLGALIPLETNAEQVKGYKTEHFPLWRLRSVSDVEAFCAAFCEAGIVPDGAMEVPTFLRRYDDAFFADRELFVCYTVEGSGSNLQAVYAPVVIKDERTVASYPLPDMSVWPTLVKDGTLTFSVGSVSPEGGTCDIADWFLFLPVEKAAAKDCASFDCVRAESRTLPYDEFSAAYQGKTRWAYASRKRLAADAELVLRPYQEIAFSLENAQDGGYLWEYETDAVVRAYDDLFTAEDENFDLWIREDLVNEPNTAPGASGLHLYTIGAYKPGAYTLRFKLKRSWEEEPVETRTVTLIVSNVMKQ